MILGILVIFDFSHTIPPGNEYGQNPQDLSSMVFVLHVRRLFIWVRFSKHFPKEPNKNLIYRVWFLWKFFLRTGTRTGPIVPPRVSAMQLNRQHNQGLALVNLLWNQVLKKSMHSDFQKPRQKCPTSPLFTLDVDFLPGTDCREPTYCVACCPEALRW